MKSGKSRLWDILQLAWALKKRQGHKTEDKNRGLFYIKRNWHNTWQPNTIHDPWLDLEYKTKHKHTNTESLAIKDIYGKLKKFIR